MGDETSLRALLARSPLVGAGDLTFVAGSVAASAEGVSPLFGWVAGLKSEGAPRWWQCAEWTDRVRLDEAPPEAPGDLARLVWGRWFAGAGDLELWREGERFRWRFLGDPGQVPPAEVAHEDFFADGSGGAARLRRGEPGTALLWRATDGRIATADRETTAYLRRAPGRLRVRFTPYYDHGVVAAVRYLEVVAEDAQPERGR